MQQSSSIASLLTDLGLNPHLIDFYPQQEEIRDGLSRRDIAFCYLLSKGIERGDAFQVAYTSTIGTASGLREAAYQRCKKAVIQNELRRLVEEKEQPKPVTDVNWLQQTVMEEMVNMMRNYEIAPANRIKAGEILLRHISVVMIELARIAPEANKTTPLEEIEKLLRMNANPPKQLPASEEPPLN